MKTLHFFGSIVFLHIRCIKKALGNVNMKMNIKTKEFENQCLKCLPFYKTGRTVFNSAVNHAIPIQNLLCDQFGVSVKKSGSFRGSVCESVRG